MISKESKTVLFVLYKQYLSRRKCGYFKADAMRFSSSIEIQKDFFPDMFPEDVDAALLELDQQGFVKVYSSDTMVHRAYLTDLAITTIESLPKEALSSLVKFLLHFVP